MGETKNVFSKHPLLTASFVLLLSLTLIFNNVLLGNTFHIANRNREIDNWANAYFYTLTDNIDQEEEIAFWNMADCVQRMKGIVEDFESSKYNYCIFSKQSINAIELKMPDEYYYFLPHEDNGNPIYSEGLLDTYQFNQNAWNFFNLQVEDGRGLESVDFQYGKTIPVVLGYEYRDYLEVGSVIECYYLEQIINLSVVGILSKNSLIVRQGTLEQLDWSIIMPSLQLGDIISAELISTTEMGKFFRKMYIQKLEGCFALADSSDLSELMIYVNDTRSKYGIFKLEFLAMPRDGITLLSNISNQYMETKIMWSLAMLILLMLCFTRFTGLIFQKNARRYAIFVISGASYVQVFRMVMASTLTLVIIANLVAYIITLLLIGIRYSILLCVFSLLLDGMVSLTMFKKYIQTSDGLVAFLDNE